ncbi:MAG: FecR domain-containing protein [Elusimicrobiota bacterium]
MNKLIGGGLLAALLLVSVPRFSSAAGRVISVDGALTAGGRALTAGDELPDAEIRLATGTATLGIEGGRFLLHGPAIFTPRKSSFRLTLGSLLSVLKHRPGLRFSVRTPSAVAAVRGTDFFVEVVPSGEVQVCICRGELEVSAKGMKTVPMAAEHHLPFRFWKTASGVTHDDAPLKGGHGHNDAELDVLRGLLAADKP